MAGKIGADMWLVIFDHKHISATIFIGRGAAPPFSLLENGRLCRSFFCLSSVGSFQRVPS